MLKKISAVVYLTDADPDESVHSTEQLLHFYMTANGNTHDLCYKPSRGDVLMFKSTVLHGAYPVRDNKRVFVVDYFYKDKK